MATADLDGKTKKKEELVDGMGTAEGGGGDKEEGEEEEGPLVVLRVGISACGMRHEVKPRNEMTKLKM